MIKKWCSAHGLQQKESSLQLLNTYRDRSVAGSRCVSLMRITRHLCNEGSQLRARKLTEECCQFDEQIGIRY